MIYEDHLQFGIDASNVRSGGGLAHLVHMLSAANSVLNNDTTVHLWVSSLVAEKVPDFTWLKVHSPSWCNGNSLRSSFGRQFLLPLLLKKFGCDVLFSPGGVLPIVCTVPTVTMSQNMLPFEKDRALLFGRWSLLYFKMRLLRLTQGATFRRAHGVIFLTAYARDYITAALGDIKGMSQLIPHGIEPRFRISKQPNAIASGVDNMPLRILYVSVQLPYKHHIEVMQSITYLRKTGRKVELHMVGQAVGSYGKAVKRTRLSLDPSGVFLHDLGQVDHNRLHVLYQNADVFLFASSCENMPNIIIEAMASGLPIVCSERGPMKEILGNAGVYFDPESINSISVALDSLIDDHAMRGKLARHAWLRAQDFSWERCAFETFEFLSKVAKQKYVC